MSGRAARGPRRRRAARSRTERRPTHRRRCDAERACRARGRTLATEEPPAPRRSCGRFRPAASELACGATRERDRDPAREARRQLAPRLPAVRRRALVGHDRWADGGCSPTVRRDDWWATPRRDALDSARDPHGALARQSRAGAGWHAHIRRRRRRGALLQGPERAHLSKIGGEAAPQQLSTGPRRAPRSCRAGAWNVSGLASGRAERFSDRGPAGALPAPRAGDAARVRRGLERGRVVGRHPLRRFPRRIPARARRALGGAALVGEPRRSGTSRAPTTCRSTCRPRTTRRRCSPRTTRASALPLARRAAQAPGADEARPQEHQGAHRHRVRRRGATPITGPSDGYSKYDGL